MKLNPKLTKSTVSWNFDPEFLLLWFSTISWPSFTKHKESVQWIFHPTISPVSVESFSRNQNYDPVLFSRLCVFVQTKHRKTERVAHKLTIFPLMVTRKQKNGYCTSTRLLSIDKSSIESVPTVLEIVCHLTPWRYFLPIPRYKHSQITTATPKQSCQSLFAATRNSILIHFYLHFHSLKQFNLRKFFATVQFPSQPAQFLTCPNPTQTTAAIATYNDGFFHTNWGNKCFFPVELSITKKMELLLGTP